MIPEQHGWNGLFLKLLREHPDQEHIIYTDPHTGRGYSPAEIVVEIETGSALGKTIVQLGSPLLLDKLQNT